MTDIFKSYHLFKKYVRICSINPLRNLLEILCPIPFFHVVRITLHSKYFSRIFFPTFKFSANIRNLLAHTRSNAYRCPPNMRPCATPLKRTTTSLNVVKHFVQLPIFPPPAGRASKRRLKTRGDQAGQACARVRKEKVGRSHARDHLHLQRVTFEVTNAPLDQSHQGAFGPRCSLLDRAHARRRSLLRPRSVIHLSFPFFFTLSASFASVRIGTRTVRAETPKQTGLSTIVPPCIRYKIRFRFRP